MGRTQATLESLDYPTLGALAAIEEQNMVKYHDVYRMDDEDIELIRRHFPTLTDEEIAENIDLITEYYDRNLQYDVFQELLSDEFDSETTNGRTAGYQRYVLERILVHSQ